MLEDLFLAAMLMFMAFWAAPDWERVETRALKDLSLGDIFRFFLFLGFFAAAMYFLIKAAPIVGAILNGLFRWITYGTR